MPKPVDGESRDEFLERCMADSEANQDFPDPAQRYAFCNSQWERRAMTYEELLAKLKSRQGGAPFGYGMATADAYVRQVLKECGGALALEDAEVERLLKEAENRLVYCGEDSVLETCAAGAVDMKAAIPKNLELPVNTLMVLVHRLTSPKEDRDRDVLLTEGAVVDPKMPLLWQHMHTLPIGKYVATLTHSAKVLRLATVLLDLNELTADAAKLIEADVLRFSHGFRATDWEERKDKDGNWIGFTIKAFEIMEESLVSVPSNTDAEMELYSRDKLKSAVFRSHAKAIMDARPVVVPGIGDGAAKAESPEWGIADPVEVPPIVAEAATDPPQVDPEPAVPKAPKADDHKWTVYYEGGQTAEATVVDPPADPPADGEKRGRELSAANLKTLKSVLDDLDELVEDKDLKRGARALIERCRDQVKALIERVSGEDDDDGKATDPVTVGALEPVGALEAARVLLASNDTELKMRAAKALAAQIRTAALDERGREFGRLLRE